MAKRFTCTEKWRKPWFRGLPWYYRELWSYVCDHCDHAGIWYVDIDMASYVIGHKFDHRESLAALGKQIAEIGDGSRWFLHGFVSFQYGDFSKKSNVHASVLRTLSSLGLAWPKPGPSLPLPKAQAQGQGKGSRKGNGNGGRQGKSDGNGVGFRSVGVPAAVAA